MFINKKKIITKKHKDKTIKTPNLIKVENVKITKLFFNVSSIELKVNETYQLNLKYEPESAMIPNVTWESYNQGFATVNQNGLITAIYPGDLYIKVYLTDDPSIYAECFVKVSSNVEEPETPEYPIEDTSAMLISNELSDVRVGDVEGIIVAKLPYDVFESVPFSLKSSDESILSVDNANCINAHRIGTVTLNMYDGEGLLRDSREITVQPAISLTEPTAAEILNVNLTDFGITTGYDVSKEIAEANSNGIGDILYFAKKNGYKKVVLPANSEILIDPQKVIYARSNVNFDFNNSTLKIRPNDYNTYCAIKFQEYNSRNLFTNITYDSIENETIEAGSVLSTHNLTVADEITTFYTNTIPVQALPTINSSDKRYINIDKNEILYNKIGFSFNATAIDSSKTHGVSITQYIEYLNNNQVVTSISNGNYWVRNYTGTLFSYLNGSYQITLREEDDYDSIRFKYEIKPYNCTSKMYVEKASEISMYNATDVLENAKFCNGVILGERDEKSNYFPDWEKVSSTEGCLAIIFEEGFNNGIENMTVKKSPGFNISAGIGRYAKTVRAGVSVGIVATNLEFGNYDKNGNPIDSDIVQRTIEMIDISKIADGDQYQLGYPFKYMGYDQVRARYYDIYYFDENKQFIERRKAQRSYRNYTKVSGAKYAHFVFHWSTAITSGDSDFGNKFCFMVDYKPPYRNYMKNCIIEDNYSTGYAACGGIKWRLEGNTFRNNSGRLPSCDIDWEDGWEFVQDDIVINNNFESWSGIVVCSGNNIVVKNNNHLGMMTYWGRSENNRVIGNIIGRHNGEASVKTFASQTDMYIADNTFKTGNCSYSKQHSTANYKCFFLNNTIGDGGYIASGLDDNGTISNTYFEGTGSIQSNSVIKLVKNCSFSASNNFVILNSYSKYENCTFIDAKIRTASAGNANNFTMTTEFDNCKLINTNFDEALYSLISIHDSIWSYNGDGSIISMPNNANMRSFIAQNNNISLGDSAKYLFYGYNVGNLDGNILDISNNTINISSNNTNLILLEIAWVDNVDNPFVINLLNNIINGSYSSLRGPRLSLESASPHIKINTDLI